MNRVGAFIVGYIAASAAAAITYTLLVMASVSVLGVEHPSELSVADQWGVALGFTILVGGFVITTSFFPSIVAYTVLRLVGLRDAISHMIAGVVVSAAAVQIAHYIPLMERLSIDWAIATCGAVAGAAFWAVTRKLAPRQNVPAAP